MGAFMAKPMQEAMQKNQKTMLDSQKEMQMKVRQVQLANQFAIGKERFQWFQAFFFTVTSLCLIGAIRTQKPQILAPVIVLGFTYGYQYDMFYGNKMYRVRKEAERLIAEEPELFFLPKGNEIYTEEDYIQALNIKKRQKKD